jgi:hypothetical protein
MMRSNYLDIIESRGSERYTSFHLKFSRVPQAGYFLLPKLLLTKNLVLLSLSLSFPFLFSQFSFFFLSHYHLLIAYLGIRFRRSVSQNKHKTICHYCNSIYLLFSVQILFPFFCFFVNIYYNL